MRRYDGAYRWFLFRFEPFRDETGAVAGELVTAIETASAERVAHERRENEARLQAAAELVGLARLVLLATWLQPR